MHRSFFLVLAALVAGSAAAQGEEPRPDPTAPKAKVPPAEYRSAFGGYQRFTEEKVAPWRQSNAVVKDAKGSDAQAPQAPAEEKAVAKPPARLEHGGHR
jgi:hypothetical protein